jgi:uncharacterized protein
MFDRRSIMTKIGGLKFVCVCGVLLFSAASSLCASNLPAGHPEEEMRQSAETAKLNAQILLAAEQDDTQEASRLLKKHASPNAASGDGMTVLHWAAYNDDLPLAKELLHYGARPDVHTRLRDLTPLHMAAETGDAGLIQLLLDGGAKADALNESGTTPLMIAAASGSTAAVEALLSHGADVNAREKTYGQTALFFAASHDRADVVRLLLSKGADATVKTSIGKLERVTLGVNGEAQDDQKTSDKIAADKKDHPAKEVAKAKPTEEAGKPEEASKQEEANKTAQKPEEKGKDAYGLTAADRKKRVYGTLQIGGMTALLVSARDGQSSAVNALLDATDDINQTSDTDHATALVLALINGHYDLAKVLLDRGADPKLATSDGITPLYVLLDVQWAPHTWYPQPVTANEHMGYLELAKSLLDHGADPNVTIKKKLWFRVFANDETWFEVEGATPFLRAAVASDVAAMKLLFDHGADPNIKTTSGDTPLMAAAGIGWAAYWTANAPYARLDAVKFCLDHGADLKAVDVKGYTALHGAAFRGDSEMAQYLISLGADIHAKTKDGDTVADFANGLFEHAMIHPEAVALLEQMGSANSHNCRSNECVVPPKEDKAPVVAKADKPASANAQAQPENPQENKQK